MTDADRFHIPPTAVCQFCGPNFLGKCPHSPAQLLSATYTPHQPAAPGVDLSSFVAWFRDELARERTAAADAKCEARGHRERVVELEARLKAEQERVADWTHKATSLAEQLEHARCDAKDAQQMLMDERKRVQVPREELTPGSVEAIKAAVRLVCGGEPRVQPQSRQPYWCAPGLFDTERENDARIALLKLLETLQPAATVKS